MSFDHSSFLASFWGFWLLGPQETDTFPGHAVRKVWLAAKHHKMGETACPAALDPLGTARHRRSYFVLPHFFNRPLTTGY